jgi:hypothetical protein
MIPLTLPPRSYALHTGKNHMRGLNPFDFGRGACLLHLRGVGTLPIGVYI